MPVRRPPPQLDPLGRDLVDVDRQGDEGPAEVPADRAEGRVDPEKSQRIPAGRVGLDAPPIDEGAEPPVRLAPFLVAQPAAWDDARRQAGEAAGPGEDGGREGESHPLPYPAGGAVARATTASQGQPAQRSPLCRMWV